MTREEKIINIQECLMNTKYPFAMPTNFYTGNCYAYALGSTFKDISMEEYIYNLGCISHVYYPPKSIEEGIKAFECDMDTLGIDHQPSTFEEILEEDEWKVAFFYDDYDPDYYDFHFMVQNNDGSWSHVLYFGGPLRRFGKDNPSNYKTDLTFVGFYKLKVNKEKVRKRSL